MLLAVQMQDTRAGSSSTAPLSDGEEATDSISKNASGVLLGTSEKQCRNIVNTGHRGLTGAGAQLLMLLLELWCLPTLETSEVLCLHPSLVPCEEP